MLSTKTMKKTTGFCLGILMAVTAGAQKPVTWNYSTKKISSNVYELHLKATIDRGWHLYAQQQPKNFIGVPTTIRFSNHPFLVFVGTIRELGDLKKNFEPVLDVAAWQYNNEVDFVQRVTTKNNVKTNVNGSIEFQACTDERCLQPATVSFSIPLKE